MFSLMGNCITWTKGKQEPRKTITLLAVGLDNAGKTTTVHGVKGDLTEEVAPTMGFSSIDVRSGKYDIKIFDLGGGARIRGIWHNYMAEAHGIVFVVDSSDMERAEECKMTFENLVSDLRIRGKPVLILANKQDRPEAMDENDLCNRLNLDEVVNANECLSKVVLCSALPQNHNKRSRKKPKLDRGIKMGFVWLLDVIGQEYALLQERITKDVDAQRQQEEEERRQRIERVRKRREEQEKLEMAEENATLNTGKQDTLSTIHSATESEENLPHKTAPENILSNPSEPKPNKFSALGTDLLDDDDEDDQTSNTPNHEPSTGPVHTLGAGLPGAVNNSTDFEKQTRQSTEQPADVHGDHNENLNGIQPNTTPRSLSIASLREIVRDTPTPVAVPAVQSLQDAASRTSSPLDQVPTSLDSQDNGDKVKLDATSAPQKKKRKKRAKKKNKIDPTLNDLDSENSFHIGAAPGRLTPLSKTPDALPNIPNVLPPLRTVPNFGSDVEI